MEGWVKIHRKMTEWGWYRDGVTLRVFLHLLLIANREKSEYEGYTVPVGGKVIGRKALSEILGVTQRQVRTALTHLASTNELTIKTTNRFSIISITKWEDYQVGDHKEVKRKSNRSQTDVHSTRSKEVEKKEVCAPKKITPKAKMDKEKDDRLDFLEQEVAEWINENTSKDVRNRWFKKYNNQCLKIQLTRAYDHLLASPKEYKSISLFVTGWLGRTREEDLCIDSAEQLGNDLTEMLAEERLRRVESGELIDV